MNAPTPISAAERAITNVARAVAIAPREQRLSALREAAHDLQHFVADGWINPAVATDRIFEVAGSHNLVGEPGSDDEAEIMKIAQLATFRDSAYAQNLLPDDNIIQPASEPPLSLICPPAWRNVPLAEMSWLATNRIPAGDATILSADGGSGKTTAALQLAVAVERDLGDWLGTTCASGPVIFFSGEEPEQEMRRRLDRVARKRGLDPADIENLHFHFADPDGCLLGVSRPNGPIVPTPLFEALRTAAIKIRPALIVIDSIAATFGGNQNDRVHARTFVGMFRRLARQADCAVLLLDHPSLSGITNGTGRGGSMDWQNATRARLHLETVEGEDGKAGRVLEVKKLNYGPSGEKVRLQWEDGCFVLEGTASAPHKVAASANVEELFLRLLAERNAQGRWVTPKKATGYAPKELAEMRGAENVTATAFARAMERLFNTNRITVETFGPPSKSRQRLVATVPTTLPTEN